MTPHNSFGVQAWEIETAKILVGQEITGNQEKHRMEGKIE